MYRIIGADGREYGPVAVDVLRRWIAERRVTGQTRVQADGSAEWKPLSALPELADDAPPPIVGTPEPLGGSPVGSSRNHPMAVAGFVMSLLGLSCCCSGPLFSLIGLVLSVIALAETRKYPRQFDNRSLAIAGIVLGLLGLALSVFAFFSGLAVNLFEQGSHWRPHRGWT